VVVVCACACPCMRAVCVYVTCKGIQGEGGVKGVHVQETHTPLCPSPVYRFSVLDTSIGEGLV